MCYNIYSSNPATTLEYIMRLGVIVDLSRGPILVAILCNLGAGHRMVEDVVRGCFHFVPTDAVLEI